MPLNHARPFRDAAELGPQNSPPPRKQKPKRSPQAWRSSHQRWSAKPLSSFLSKMLRMRAATVCTFHSQKATPRQNPERKKSNRNPLREILQTETLSGKPFKRNPPRKILQIKNLSEQPFKTKTNPKPSHSPHPPQLKAKRQGPSSSARCH